MRVHSSFGLAVFLLSIVTLPASAASLNHVSDETVSQQRTKLAQNTINTGIGPQSPRDIDNTLGVNRVVFSPAPSSENMNLCNIHLHKNAEHKGGEFTTSAGNGDGYGYNTGYKYSGQLTAA